MVIGVPRRRAVMGFVATVGAVLLLASCSTGGSSSADKNAADCAPYKKWVVDSDVTVTAYGSIRDIEADRLAESWKKFEDCTGITIEYEGSGEFEAQINVRVKGGNAPDLAFFPQPGLLTSFVDQGKIKVPTATVKENATKGWTSEWIKYGTVNGTFYGAPLGGFVKSFVWYSPGAFKKNGWTVPTTWAELIALSNKIAATGEKPWCAGIESGDATGWPATDWIEDVMLRTAGPDTYDKWVNHTIPFNDPSVAKALDQVGSILKNPKYVNGGYGDVKSISTTSFQEGGLPILKDKCALHRQASFYGAQWPKGTKVGPDGDVYAFYLPAVDPAAGKPVLGSGEIVGAFSSDKAVQNVQEYLSTAEWANSRAKIGSGWTSANKGLDVSNLSDPIDKLSYETLQDPKAVFRFDGSDLMPAQVGSGSEWKQMVAWINGQNTKTTLDNIEKTWPK